MAVATDNAAGTKLWKLGNVPFDGCSGERVHSLLSIKWIECTLLRGIVVAMLCSFPNNVTSYLVEVVFECYWNIFTVAGILLLRILFYANEHVY